jgi:hypothetical protein
MIWCIAALTEDSQILEAKIIAHCEQLACIRFGRLYQDYEFLDAYCTAAGSWGAAKDAGDWARDTILELHGLKGR